MRNNGESLFPIILTTQRYTTAAKSVNVLQKNSPSISWSVPERSMSWKRNLVAVPNVVAKKVFTFSYFKEVLSADLFSFAFRFGAYYKGCVGAVQVTPPALRRNGAGSPCPSCSANFFLRKAKWVAISFGGMTWMPVRSQRNLFSSENECGH